MELFIGRIPPSGSLDKITEIFAPYGASNVRILEGKGCAFANFDNQFDAERAITELNGFQMGPGPGLNVKPATNKSTPAVTPIRAPAPAIDRPLPTAVPLRRMDNGGPPAPASRDPPPSAPQPQLFIGRLPPKTQQRELEDLLMPYGALNVKLLEGKNCAFANFDSWAPAERCIEELNGVQLREGDAGEGLNVKFADMKGIAKGALQEPKVFVGGLSPEASDEDVQRHAEQFGAVVHCKIFTKNDRAMPCAFVTFGSFTEAERCIQHWHDQQHPLAAEGKTLVVKMADMAKSALRAAPAIREPHHPLPMRPSFTPAPAAMPVQHAPIAPMHRAPMPHAPIHHPPMSTFEEGRKHGSKDMRPAGGDLRIGVEEEKLFIGGLPEEANEDFVWGMMAPFGRVAEVKILRKSNSTGCGFVTYTNLGEAQIAVQALSNCRFTVKFADAKGPGTKRPASMAFGDAFERRMR